MEIKSINGMHDLNHGLFCRILPVARSCGLCKLCGTAIVDRDVLAGRRNSSGGLVPSCSSSSTMSFCSADEPGSIGVLFSTGRKRLIRRCNTSELRINCDLPWYVWKTSGLAKCLLGSDILLIHHEFAWCTSKWYRWECTVALQIKSQINLLMKLNYLENVEFKLN